MKKLKKTAVILVTALSLNTIGASMAFAAQPQGATDSVKSQKSNSSSSALKNEDIKIIDQDTFEVNGVKYSISAIANSINPNSEITTNAPAIQPNSVVSIAVRKAFNWVVGNWTYIVSKVPASLQTYLKLDGFMKAADQFLDISGSIEEFFHSTFRAMGMPESANWVITNIIMIALPI